VPAPLARQVGGADDVQDDVGAPAVSERVNGGREVLVAVVDGKVSAELTAPGELAGRPCRAHHPGAENAAELDRRCTNSADAAMHEERLARRQPGIHHDVGVDGAGGLRKCSRVQQADAAGSGSNWPAGTATCSA
jgi:hypothetical protein